MRIYPSYAAVDGYLLYENIRFPNVPRVDKIPVTADIFKRKEYENVTLSVSFSNSEERGLSQFIYDLKTKELHQPRDPNYIPEYFNVLKISDHKYVIIGSIIRGGHDGQIIEKYQFVGQVDYLPEEIEYLTLE